MNAGGLSQAQWISVGSAVALIVSLFLAWGGAGGDIPDVPEIPDTAPSIPGLEDAQNAAEDAAELTGWESQNTLDIYLAILAGLVLANAALAMGGNREGLPFAPVAATMLLGAIGVILVAYVLIDIPEGAERKIGIYIATAAAIGVTIGSYLQLREEVSRTY